MPLTVPPRWSHGDYPTAAEMNKYSDGQNYLDGVLGNGTHQAVAKSDGEILSFVHIWRWLHYWTTSGSTATLSDPSGANEDTTLPDSDGDWAVYDLAQVDWLTQGQIYQLTGVDYAAEDYES